MKTQTTHSTQASLPSPTSLDGKHSPVVLTAAEMKQAEETCFDAGLPVAALMEQAIQNMAAHIAEAYPQSSYRNVVVLAGKGGNGADGYGLARALALRGYMAAAYEWNLSGTAPSELNLAQKNFAAHCQVRLLPSAADIHKVVGVCAAADLIVDALCGIGFKGELPPACVEFVAALQQELANRRPGPVVIALDGPSGLDMDGRQDPRSLHCLRAHETLTLGSLKPALVDDALAPFTGRVQLIPLAVPLPTTPATPRLLSTAQVWQDLVEALALSSAFSHKYARGRAIISAGSTDYPGAQTLALAGALASLPGYLQSLCDPKAPGLEAYPSVVPLTLEALLAQHAHAATSERPVACLFGPGQRTFAPDVVEFIGSWQGPVVLDAGALSHPEILRLFPYPSLAALAAPRILTPHRAEFEQMWNHFDELCHAAPTSLSLMERVQRAAITLNAVIVLKGANTLLATPEGHLKILHSPVSLLGTAGTGDVLAGFLTGLLARGIPLATSLSAAVVLHNLAARRYQNEGLATAESPRLPSAGELCVPRMLAKGMQSLMLAAQQGAPFPQF